MAGATTIPVAVFDPETTLRALGATGSPTWGVRPRSSRALLDHPARREVDLSAMRVGVVSAALRAGRSRLPDGQRVGPRLHDDRLRADRVPRDRRGHLRRRPARHGGQWSCRPLPDAEVRLVDER